MNLDLATSIALISLCVSVAWPYLAFRDKLITMMADLKSIKQEVGTHDDGMRGELHEHSNMIQDHEARLTFLEEKRA